MLAHSFPGGPQEDLLDESAGPKPVSSAVTLHCHRSSGVLLLWYTHAHAHMLQLSLRGFHLEDQT